MRLALLYRPAVLASRPVRYVLHIVVIVVIRWHAHRMKIIISHREEAEIRILTNARQG